MFNENYLTINIKNGTKINYFIYFFNTYLYLFIATASTTASTAATAATTATTAAAAAPAPPTISALRNKTMEEILNKWTSELNHYHTEFQKVAVNVGKWDQMIIQNGAQVSN